MDVGETGMGRVVERETEGERREEGGETGRGVEVGETGMGRVVEKETEGRQRGRGVKREGRQGWGEWWRERQRGDRGGEA